MATLTAPNSIPNFEQYETHTVVVDNLDHTNKTDFTAFLPVALEDVVRAQLLAASISTTGDAQRCIHINIEELRTTFSQRAKADLASAADNHLNGLFGSIMCQHVIHGSSSNFKAVYFRDEYPIVQDFLTPIQKLDRLSLNIDKQDGSAAAMAEGIFVFKFTCKRKHLSVGR